MARDTAAVMKALRITRAPIVGYSDAGIIALELGIYDRQLVASVFAYGANSNPGALVNPPRNSPQNAVDAASAAWSMRVYRAQSPTPQAFHQIEKRIERMWATQPHLTAAQLRTIRVPVWIVDGDRDEIASIDSDFMSSAIPLGKELILPGATHYAL